ncbi:MAG: iron-sulfur cluster repair protein YtfE [Planctomycetes bacterium]|nr:iron-sulfur cluster repair protein YtfE [Planctomycetota bacterium]
MSLKTQTTLAEMATTHPTAARVFHRHRLDFCCGGRRSLSEACQERGLDAATIIVEIENEPTSDRDLARWDEADVNELIQHILDRYHEPARPEIARLAQMAVKVEAVHAERPDVPRGLAAQLTRMVQEIDEHFCKEEQVLFPMVLRGHGAMAGAPIHVMGQEHDDHGENLRRVRALANDLVPPADACATWRALYLGLEQFELELMEHIHLENNVLFPKILGH